MNKSLPTSAPKRKNASGVHTVHPDTNALTESCFFCETKRFGLNRKMLSEPWGNMTFSI